MVSNIKHLFMCLLVISSQRCLFKSFARFRTGLFCLTRAPHNYGIQVVAWVQQGCGEGKLVFTCSREVNILQLKCTRIIVWSLVRNICKLHCPAFFFAHKRKMDKSSQDPYYPDREMKSKATGSTGKNLVLPLFLTKTWMSCSGCWWRGCPRPLSSRLGCRHCPPRHVIVTTTTIRNTGSFAPSGTGGSSSSPSSSSRCAPLSLRFAFGFSSDSSGSGSKLKVKKLQASSAEGKPGGT